MPIKLYKMDLSPAARAAMMACELFNAPVEFVDVNLMAGEHLTPEYLKKNPVHTVPVFEDGDFIIHDSHAILMYLADKYGKTDEFYPKDIKQRALVNQKLFFDTAILIPRLASISIPVWTEGKCVITEKQIKNIEEAYSFVEEFLSRTKYVAANHITIADLSVIASMTSITIPILPLDSTKYPKTHAWMKDMESQPYCKKHNEPGATAYGQMPIKLYKLDWSPPARAAMMACEIFNVPVEFIDVDLANKKHLTPEYLQKNPLHTVPLFEDGDFVIHDSHAILMYMADKYGKTDEFYPKDIKQRALVNQKLFFDTSILFPRLRNVTYAAFMENVKTMTEKQRNDIDEAYSFLEQFLSRTKYLAGDRITIADISAISNVTSLIYLLPLDSAKYPKTHTWMKEMESQPYCKKYNEPGATGLGNFIKQTIKT